MNERVQYLLSQYESNNCSRGEMEELFAHIKNMETNNEELKAMIKRVYDNICKDHPSFTYVTQTGELVFSDPQQPDTINHFPHAADENLKVIKVYRRILILATVLIASSLVLIGIKRFSEDRKNMQAATVAQQVFETTTGQSKMLFLADSTQVWLNAGSTLIAPTQFLGGARKVELSGEALFKIRKQGTDAFIIKTAEATAVAEGSATCNIKAYHDENSTVLSVGQGIIAVKREDKLLSTLTAGRLMKFGKAEKSVTEKDFSMRSFAAWQWGELIYENVMFKDILLDLQRKYDHKINFDQSQKLKTYLTVSFKSDTEIHDIMKALANITQSEIEDTDNGFVIR